MTYIVSKRCRTYSVIRHRGEFHVVYFDKDGKLTSVQVFEGEGIDLGKDRLPEILTPSEAQARIKS